MKKLLLSLSLFMTITVVSAAANDPDPVSEAVKTSFKKEFPGAEIIAWKNYGDYLMATFIFSGYRSEAYFSREGDFHGSARALFYNQVPLAVTKAVEKRFTSPEVLQVSEITSNNGTSYLLRLDAGQKKYMVQMDAGGNVINVEKLKK